MRPFCLLLCAAVFAAGEAVPPVVTPPTPKPVVQPAAKAYLGVAIDTAATAFAGSGLVILRVEPNSPAAVMGLQAGDRLLTIDGVTVKSQDELAAFMGGKKPNDAIKVEFQRAQGKEGLAEKKTANGILQEAPRSRTANLGSQIGDLQARIAELAQKGKEPTLAEVLQKLKDIEADLPRAAEQFKKVYPNGEFRIVISVEITSDKTAKDPLAIDVKGAPAADPKAAPAVDSKKPQDVQPAPKP